MRSLLEDVVVLDEGSLACRVVTIIGLLVVLSIVELRWRLWALTLELLVTGSFLTV